MISSQKKGVPLMEKQLNDKKCCCCPCHAMSGILIALIGLVFLLGSLEVLSQKVVAYAWPVLLILLGLKNSIGKGKCKCCDDA